MEGDPAPDAGNALTDAAEQASLAAQTIVSLRAIRQRLADEELRFSAETERLTARIENEAAAQATEIARLKALIPASSPRQALEVYARSHAIFFSDQTTFRDEAAARSILDALAGLMKHDPSLLRVVGYTDDSGNPAKNAVLSKARAEIAANGLIARGIAVNRIVILGRTATESNVATTVGVRSPNRRVEFEPGFIGENAE